MQDRDVSEVCKDAYRTGAGWACLRLCSLIYLVARLISPTFELTKLLRSGRYLCGLKGFTLKYLTLFPRSISLLQPPQPPLSTFPALAPRSPAPPQPPQPNSAPLPLFLSSTPHHRTPPAHHKLNRHPPGTSPPTPSIPPPPRCHVFVACTP